MKDTYIPYEQQYLNNIKYILNQGAPCDAERTGTGTRMTTGLSFRVDLQREFPILTSKKMDIAKIVAENIWFISGSTSNEKLNALGAGIWNEWADDAEQLGPLYGAMWRRRPATAIQYAEKPQRALGGKARPMSRSFVSKQCRKSIDTTGVVSTLLRRRMEDINTLWHDMLSRAAAEGAVVYDKWRKVEGFIADFDTLAGNELLHSMRDKSEYVFGKKLVVTNAQHNVNYYGPETVCIVHEFLLNEYPRKKLADGNALCPVFYYDQLGLAIEQLKDHSQSRRIVIDCWDPSLLPVDGVTPKAQASMGLQALAPCHPLFQFNVVPAHNGKPAQLDVSVYMRSQDYFLGTPYNMAGYAVLALMVAKVTGLRPGILTMMGGNCHVYANHVKQVKKQLRRKPRGMVQMAELPEVIRIEDFKVEDFKLLNYKSAGVLKGAVAV